MSLLPDDNNSLLCFDGLEEELAISIVDLHHSIIQKRGFDPVSGQEQRDETVGKVTSAVSSAFGSFFGAGPNTRYANVFEQVADFAAHLSKDHYFFDGNKRTTVVIFLAILYFAGCTLDVGDSEDPEGNLLYQWVQDVVTGGRTIQELAEILQEHSQRI